MFKKLARRVRNALRLPDDMLSPDALRARHDRVMRQRIHDGLVIRGKTYKHRHRIRKAGGVWDGLRKQWIMPSRESLISTGAIETDHGYAVFPEPEEGDDDEERACKHQADQGPG